MRLPTLLIALGLITTALAGCDSHPLPDACYQKPDSGRCRASFTRYYFDGTQCKAFIWGGCGGSVPFHDFKTCQQTCLGITPKPGETPPSGKQPLPKPAPAASPAPSPVTSKAAP